tara:strand:- start:111 stop:395 length:285 start_codon:yes stop_codon:yes gene_type:complete
VLIARIYEVVLLLRPLCGGQMHIIARKRTMKPSAGAVVVFDLTHIEGNIQFIDGTNLPLTTLGFKHRYETLAVGGARIIHAADMRGLLTPFFSV